jgi:hydrogenase-4 component B
VNVAESFAVALAFVALLGPVAVLLAAPARRGAVAGIATTAAGVAGLGVGVGATNGGFEAVTVTWLFPLGGATFGADATSGLFVLITSAVAAAVGVYTVGYHARSPLPTGALACLPLFVASMIAVPVTGSVTSFLFFWELMALTSVVLVLADHHHGPARAAGQLYAVMTQLGFLAILLGLAVFAARGGSDSFASLAASASRLPDGTRAAVFLLTLTGFGSKAGLVPLHAWLPRAHPEAPSPVSALMSAAMVNLGVYGIVRVDLDLLGPGPRWWGLLLLVVGALTAVYAVLQASVATDLKRLLAYSTSENMGLVALALGAFLLVREAGNPLTARIALAAALLHLFAHAAFKTLAFLCAGGVLTATGVRDLDLLGGLARRMPATTVLFGIAALGASGLPLGAGFVSEWLLLQSLIHSRSTGGGALLSLVMPFAVGAVALTTGLSITAMVKAFGVGFLARPRSEEAEAATEVSAGMRVAMWLPAAACLVLSVAPAVAAPSMRPALEELSAGGAPSFGVLLELPGIPGSLSPGLLALGFCAAVALAALVVRPGRNARPATVPVPLWACGAAQLTPRMEYTATSFAEPLQRVFSDVLRPDVDVEVSHYSESHFLVEQIRYRSRIDDAIEHRLHRPVVAAVDWAAALLRRGHAGNVHVYLAYGGLALLVVLVLSR